jgi:alanine dehydrogenase
MPLGESDVENVLGVETAICAVRDGSRQAALRMRTGWRLSALARKSAARAGILGTTSQAGTQIEFLVRVRPIRELRALSIDSIERQETFARQVEETTGIPVVFVQPAQDVVEKAEILVTATPATEPIVRAEWISEGLQITSMGVDDPYKADMIVIDSSKALQAEQFKSAPRERILAANDRSLPPENSFAGIEPGRRDDCEITAFLSAGTSGQDAANAPAVYCTACAIGASARGVS